ncbi:MAG: tetratricopeptide repeat protein [Desulfobacteraceae bacterium]|nr:tetratricopeptide repeat protein [Desulfobacteraceae bacterium]
MTTQDFKRKLTAILSADVEGYSLLMRDDEEATVRTLTTYRKAVTKLIQQFRGRLVDATGDNFLSEFTSVVDAVNCAVEIQRELGERNIELSENRRMQFRIGINLGDVVEEGERIYGDGVNIAARMEGLAEGGGICISGKVYEEVKNKLGLEYEYLGEQEVKNIPEPVRAYRVLSFPGAAAHRVIKAKKAVSKTWRNVAVIVAALLVSGFVLAILNFYLHPTPPVEVASVKKMSFPLPDKPSIAVLPFDNLSGDASQDYFSDGITESIITALSNVSNLFVIARNSTFTYKGKPVKVQQVAEELGVRYVLEGSVQRSEDRVRVSAQLIDAITGHHLWAENYDRELDDIFALQDDITEHVTMALQVELTEGEQARIRRRHIENKEAYEYFLHGLEVYRPFTKEANAQARKIFEKTVALDPNSTLGWCFIGWTHYRDGRFGWTDTPNNSLALAEDLAHKVLAMDDSMAEAYSMLSLVYMARKQHDKAVAYGEKVLSLAPNFASMIANTAVIFFYSGRPEEAIELVKKAMRLSPYYPSWYLPILGLSYRLTGQYEEAISALEGWRDRKAKGMLPHIVLAFTYVEEGREEDAQASVAEALKQNPKASIKGYAATIPYKDPAEIERIKDSLRKAGLPETPALPLPDKPSIAVLPFENMSDDPKQEYFSDGLTEEIITALSKVRQLFVIARNSTFTYKGKPVKVQQVSRELGVRYILEGSVRKSDEQIRITAQLIDATTGNHLWAERYDRNLSDIFALQDEITKKIITAMQVKLTEGEQVRAAAKGTNNLEAYLKYLQAHELINRFNIESIALGKQLAEEAITLDPEYASAYFALGKTHELDAWLGSSKSPKASIAKAMELVQKAIVLDDTYAEAHALLGYLFSMTRQHDKAVALGEKAVTLNPNSAESHMRYGKILTFAGRYEESIPELKKAIRLNPIPPNLYLYSLGISYCWTGQYEEAITWCEKAVSREPNSFFARLFMASTYSFAGRDEEARAEAAEALRINPKFSLKKWEKRVTYKNKEDAERGIRALRKAGLK